MRKLGYSILILSFFSCGIYNFTGGSSGNAKTYQVDFFENNAPIVEPALDRNFTLALQDIIQSQTNLNLVRSEGDLQYSGEITRFDISPMTATADQTAAQNRLTIAVKVRFINGTDEEKGFDKVFSFYYDFGANQQLNTIKEAAFKQIFDRLTQDIFNASLADW